MSHIIHVWSRKKKPWDFHLPVCWFQQEPPFYLTKVMRMTISIRMHVGTHLFEFTCMRPLTHAVTTISIKNTVFDLTLGAEQVTQQTKKRDAALIHPSVKHFPVHPAMAMLSAMRLSICRSFRRTVANTNTNAPGGI